MNATFQAGEVLSIQMNGYRHYGLSDGNGMIIDASKKYGKVVLQTINSFAEGREIERHGIWAKHSPMDAVANAYNKLGDDYKLFADNCEHFVRGVSGLVKESPQIQMGIAAMIIAALFWVANK